MAGLWLDCCEGLAIFVGNRGVTGSKIHRIGDELPDTGTGTYGLIVDLDLFSCG